MKSGLFLCERSILSIVGAVVIMDGAIPNTLPVSFRIGITITTKKYASDVTTYSGEAWTLGS